MKNQMSGRSRFGVMVLCAAILLACAPDQETERAEGVADDAIRVGMIVDLTGPLAFLGQEISAGAELYFKDVNRRGGVHGRKLELVVEDDGYQPPRTVAAFHKLVDMDGIFCLLGNLGTATTMAIMRMLEDEGIPLLSPNGYSSALYTPSRRYVFPLPLAYQAQSWVMVARIADSPEAAEARLGVIYQDDDFGRDGLKGLRDAAAHFGLPIVAEEAHPRGTMDFSSTVLNMKRADPTHVILWTVLRETAAVVKEAHQLGWEPVFLGNHTAAGDQLVELAPEAFRDVDALFVTPWDPMGPEMMPYLELLEKHAPDREPAYYHVAGFAQAQGLVEALERAGRNLTREKLVEALETFEGWDENLLGIPITYGPEERGGFDIEVYFAKADVEEGRLVRASDDIYFQIPTS